MTVESLRTVLVAAVATSLLAGCGIGYNRMLFFTKTNVGLDVDTTPPTAEISVARREVVIAPTFEGGKTPPVMGGFRFKGGPFSPSVSAVFSGGRAATITSKLLFTDKESEVDANATSNPATSNPASSNSASMCVAGAPHSGLLDVVSGIPGVRLLTEETDTARPFFFATDTTTGLKVAWSGATQAIPDTFKFGYNRKEFAFAPVYGHKSNCDPEAVAGSASNDKGAGTTSADTATAKPGSNFLIEVPSFLATLGNSAGAGGSADVKYDYSQFFATGEAANELARRPEVRNVLGTRMSADLENAQKKLDKGRQDGAALKTEADGLIDKLASDADADLAREKAIAAGLIDPGTTFPADATDLSKKQAFLKEIDKPGDNKIDELRKFVELLKAAQA